MFLNLRRAQLGPLQACSCRNSKALTIFLRFSSDLRQRSIPEAQGAGEPTEPDVPIAGRE